MNPDYETKASYSVGVIAIDIAGNVSDRQIVTLNITDQVVDAPQLIDESDGTVDSDGITNDTTPTLTGTAPAQSDVEVFEGDVSLEMTTADSNGDWELTASELTEGSHEITYEFTPLGGTKSDRSDPLNITVDTTPPNITSGDAVSILDEGGANQIVYTATSVDDSQVTYDLDDGDKSEFTINQTSGAVHLIAEPSYESKSNYQFTVIATDSVDYATRKDVSLSILDKFYVEDNSGASYLDRIINTSTPTVGGNAAPGSQVELSFTPSSENYTTLQSEYSIVEDGGVELSYSPSSLANTNVVVGETGAWSFTAGSLSDGDYSVSAAIAQPDDAGSSTDPNPIAFTIDTTAPDIPSSAIAGPIEENSGANQIVHTATSTDDSAVFSLKEIDDYDSFEIGRKSGELTLIPDPDYEAKSVYSVTIEATDTAGNVSDPPQSVIVNIGDQVVDAPKLIDESDGAVDSDGITNDITPTFRGPGSATQASSTVRVFGGGDLDPLLGTTTADSDGNWQLTAPELTEGSHEITYTFTPVGGTTQIAQIL